MFARQAPCGAIIYSPCSTVLSAKDRHSDGAFGVDKAIWLLAASQISCGIFCHIGVLHV